MKIRFETTECGRCGGTGQFGPTAVDNGRCFNCTGNKTVLTRKGRAARDAYEQLELDNLVVHASELSEGDHIYSNARRGGCVNDYVKTWRKVKSIKLETREVDVAKVYTNGELKRSTMTYILITFQEIDKNTGENHYWDTNTYQPEALTFKRHDRDTMIWMMNEIDQRFAGATLIYTDADKKNDEETKEQNMEQENTTTEQQPQVEQGDGDDTQNIPQRIANARAAGYSRKMIQDLSGVTQAQLGRIEFKNSVRDHEVDALVPVLDSIENGTAEVQPRKAKKAESDDSAQQTLSRVKDTLEFVRKSMNNTRKDEIVDAVRTALDLIDNA